MPRKVKAVGLALTAALALIALAASSASATNPRFHSEVAHTSLTGEQEIRNTFSVNAGTIHCSTATFAGTAAEATTTQLTIAPTYNGCKLTTVTLETLEATVDMNGCHYLFTPGGQVHLTCPSAPIRVTAPLCTVSVAPQTVEKVDYTNVGEGTTRSVTVTSTATSLTYTQSSFCPTGGGTFSNGSYAGAVSTTCTDTFANHAGCWWSTE
ncbi:MAG TPA: hypothetical protein VGB06_08365 [Solirubrobacterales bacterium]|jgi:hypothetical protein